MVTLDDVCGGGRVALIKVDVEGHEAAVLHGAAGTISAHAPSIIFEYAPELHEDPAQTPFEWLAEQGYVMFRVRATRHPVSGRACLVLDRISEWPVLGSNFLAVSPAMASRISALPRLRVP